MNYKQRFKDMPIDSSWFNEEDRERFINEITEIAFGEDAIERGYDLDEVIARIQEFSDNALKYEEGEEWTTIIYGLYLMMLTNVL